MFKWIIEKLGDRVISSAILSVLAMMIILAYVLVSNKNDRDKH